MLTGTTRLGRSCHLSRGRGRRSGCSVIPPHLGPGPTRVRSTCGVSSRYFDEISGDRIISALHFRGAADQPTAHGDTQFKTETVLNSAVDEWHTYQVWWSPDEIRIGVDGNIEDAHFSYAKRPGATNDDWPFDHPMGLIMNIAMGGTLEVHPRQEISVTRCMWTT